MFKLQQRPRTFHSLTAILLAAVFIFKAHAATDSAHDHSAMDAETDPHAHHKMMMHGATDEDDPHAHHKAMMQNKTAYTKDTVSYAIPNLVLKDMHNDDVNINELFSTDQPLVVSFIFTTCDTICPVLTATLASAQEGLLASTTPPVMISVSIDPEEDTPARLKAYADSYDASEQWVFLTGPLDSIIQLQRAMNVYRGSKLNHEPVTFVKSPGENQWLRLDGFTSAKALVTEYRNFVN